ncbi:hypothetical protein SARC_04408 [Sphaeroforma arctica JP610]|uniref:beta-ketoacyl-[acyl-carrier-protein] synthase I n=1 Tax=Sphaeroforma arctica JP610 TaxID=667725 RepID=A0A0L0G3C0_9EUKA|nr:hypothetical protein SARC_04408 [Sphaeroforma arctica JP610]KNC83336.1 hypothetical protein SARC_04408 [Sphaeroforma arctica JP610]|eukprot:XP_014157238.1 hypothetical protein SARC_04408 [Sphaeroforma arctica JP610]
MLRCSSKINTARVGPRQLNITSSLSMALRSSYRIIHAHLCTQTHTNTYYTYSNNNRQEPSHSYNSAITSLSKSQSCRGVFRFSQRTHTTACTNNGGTTSDPPPPLPHRRVVVTGLGLITPLAVGVQATWERLLAGQSGVHVLEDDDSNTFSTLPTNIGAIVPHGEEAHQFRPNDHLKTGESRRIPPFAVYALAAADEALKDAKWTPETETEQVRTGVDIGVGIVGLSEIAETTNSLRNEGFRRVSPFFVPRILVNIAAGHVSMRYGLKGPNHAASTACATGAHSIGDAFFHIKNGNADVMVAGGVESCVSAVSVAGFARIKALSTKYNDQPEQASRPFSAGRDGFVIGEGAGIMVLEEREHAIQRGAKIYAEMRGYGSSGDAHHLTAPSPEATGAKTSMELAIRMSGLRKDQFDYINAHATSTPMGDTLEAMAISSVFGDHAPNISVSSTKGATGHLLGAAGAVESIFAVLSIENGKIPQTLNLETVDPEIAKYNLDLVAGQPKERAVRAVLSNSFGFGGTNASLCFAEHLNDAASDEKI